LVPLPVRAAPTAFHDATCPSVANRWQRARASPTMSIIDISP
jgi:hypothetical protein